MGDTTRSVEEEVVELTRAEFDWQLLKHGEYSCTLPSATTIGKKWFRNEDVYGRDRVVARTETKIVGDFPDWWQGEYVELTPRVENRVGIKWRKVKLKE